MSNPQDGAAPPPRRELLLAAALCAVGAALVLVGVSRTWVVVEDTTRLTVVSLSKEVAGSAIVPGLRELGLVALAGVVALAATRRLGRVVVGVVLAATGAVAVALAAAQLDHARLLTAASRAAHVCAANGALCSHPSGAELPTLVAHVGPVWLCLVGGVAVALSGALTVARGRRWAGLGSSYEAPGAAAPEPVTDKGVWDALDRGDDPTA